MDHQGVRDIVTDDCGIKIPVTSSKIVATALAAEITSLAKAPERYQSLSAGALLRGLYMGIQRGTHGWSLPQSHQKQVIPLE